jgi:hypothetical protein
MRTGASAASSANISTASTMSGCQAQTHSENRSSLGVGPRTRAELVDYAIEAGLVHLL